MRTNLIIGEIIFLNDRLNIFHAMLPFIRLALLQKFLASTLYIMHLYLYSQWAS